MSKEMQCPTIESAKIGAWSAYVNLTDSRAKTQITDIFTHNSEWFSQPRVGLNHWLLFSYYILQLHLANRGNLQSVGAPGSSLIPVSQFRIHDVVTGEWRVKGREISDRALRPATFQPPKKFKTNLFSFMYYKVC